MATTSTETMDELDTHTCLELLRTRDVGRLAVSITDHPDIFPINYVLDRERLSSAPQTARSWRRPCSVAVLPSRSTAMNPTLATRSVVIKGYAIEIKKLQDYFDALDLPLFPCRSEAPLRANRACPDHGSPVPCRRPRRLGRRPTDDASSRTGVTPT